MTTRDITDTFEELYGAQVSPALVSKVTAAVQQELEAWQERLCYNHAFWIWILSRLFAFCSF